MTVSLVAAVPSEPAFPALSAGLIDGDTLWLGTPQGERRRTGR